MAGNNLKEEIKLVVDHVKHKKVEGSLYLMSERIGWMPKQKDSFTVSHHYGDIKTQKISKESTDGKGKVQLQIVLHDDSSSVFHFTSPGGQQVQIKDRDQVKDLLAILLPKFKQKISKDLEEKKRILIENPHIYQLYNDLVVNQVISSEDFWKNFVDFNDFKKEIKNQPTGVAQGFMSKVIRKSDGSSTKFTITDDDIQSIFKTYPLVKLKHIQNVGDKMTEEDFWNKFFDSYYFRKDKINTVANDLFADCVFRDDEEFRNKIKRTITDPTEIIDSQKNYSTEDGFGLTDFNGAKTSNLVNQNLIKRYNFYSMRILESMEERSQDQPSGPNKKPKLDEEIRELEKDDSVTLKGASLNLVHIDRYFYAPTNSHVKQSQVDVALKNQDPKLLVQKSLTSLNNWNLNVKKIINPSLSIGILAELSPGSELMQSNNVQNIKEEIPKQNQEEIKSIYVSSCEMLKAFHAVFPPKNNEHEQKLKVMRDTLETYFRQKVLALHERLTKENFSWNFKDHLENMFQKAFIRYDSWKTKQAS